MMQIKKLLIVYAIYFLSISFLVCLCELYTIQKCKVMRKILSTSRQVVIYFFIILFVYAAVSKLTDFENFQVQVAQSPLLSAFATFIAYTTVIGELIIALMLCFKKSRLLGLYLFLAFMTAFTVYIFLILNYSPFVPCSCGGILEKMGWTEHLRFNLITTIIASAIILHNNTTKATILYIIGIILLSSVVVVLLFITSEHIMKRENPFVRRFLPHPISDLKTTELPFNSYYTAGFFNKNIYLGNTTAPLHGLILDTDTNIKDTLNLKMHNFHDYGFTSIKWDLWNDTLLLNDYTVGIFLKSDLKTKQVKITKQLDSLSFSTAVPISINRFVLRTYNDNGNNVNLSLVDIKKESFQKIEGILDEEYQPKDLFSNDGMLLFNKELQKVIYVFYYKNKVFHFNTDLKEKQVLQTIDTISTPDFTISYLEKKQQLKMSKNGTMVHKYAATSGDFLYISSDRMGKNERSELYRASTIIDVYNLKTNTYHNSFYFYNYKNKPINQFYVQDSYIIGIGSNYLSIGKFKDIHYQ